VAWPSSGNEGLFIDVFDWDSVFIEMSPVLNSSITLCSGFYPCALYFRGQSADSVLKLENGSFACLSTAGCTKIVLGAIRVVCSGISTQSVFVMKGTQLKISGATFEECASHSDGGLIHCSAFNSTVLIDSTAFHNVRSNRIGGVIYAVGCAVKLTKTNFTNCSAAAGGGAISVSEYFCYGSADSPESSLLVLDCQFYSCSSETSGGALLVTSHYGIATVSNSLFQSCSAAISGGAISASDQAELKLWNTRLQKNLATSSGGAVVLSNAARGNFSWSHFDQNTAGGDGGGAFFDDSAQVLLIDVKFTANVASSGGGGALFWKGLFPPAMISSIPQAFNLCAKDNIAAYGSCLATPYFKLLIHGWPQIVFPGIPFTIAATKLDAYNQTIATDSFSVLQVQSQDKHNSLSGTYLSVLESGTATFSVTFKMSFFVVDSIGGLATATVQSHPALYVNGLDYKSGGAMISEPVYLSVLSGNNVCPIGHVLMLENAGSISNTTIMQGVCTFCSSGTYSIDSLAGHRPSEPGCFSCPQGGICKGGSDVSFLLGTWKASNGIFVLMSCPAEHQLASIVNGIFSQTAQNCVPCPSSYYIINSNDPNISCQPCPKGALCVAGNLKGLVAGSVWVGDMHSGLYRLKSCPAGYEKAAETQDSQECRICTAYFFCTGASNPAIACPGGFFSLPGANSSDSCQQVVFVEVSITLPLNPGDFKQLQDRFQTALATIAGVASGNVVFVSTLASANRRVELMADPEQNVAAPSHFRLNRTRPGSIIWLSGERSRFRAGFRASVPLSTIVVSRIAASDARIAADIAMMMTAESVSRQLFLQNLPAGVLNYVLVVETGSPNSQNILATILGTALGGLILLIGLVFFWFWCFVQKVLDEEEASLAIRIRQLRMQFRLTKKGGYMFHSEKRWWDRGKEVMHLRPSHIEALARFSLHQDFDVVQFNGLCNFVEEEDFHEQTTRIDTTTSRFKELCDFILEISTKLIVPDIPCKHENAERANLAAEDAAWKYRYFFKLVMKASIWRSNPEVFERLKAAALVFMNEISDLCSLRHRELCQEIFGQELLSFSW
jgi:hypothetical protein